MNVKTAKREMLVCVYNENIQCEEYVSIIRACVIKIVLVV